jgi:UDP-N-acetylglucosamine--N-acetylmuramyl-(pentapeptide) pyrophosphoryl-undecaprenol N-acetylglucosamine transferase
LKQKPIIIITGGTGGHVFPAVAVYDELKKENEDVNFFVDQRGKKFVPSHIQNLIEVPIHRTFPPFGKLFYPFSLFGAFINYIIRFLNHRPKMIIGFGGYMTMPGILAAKVLQIPIILHEGNSFLGRANRFLQKFANLVLVSFQETKTDYIEKTVVTGMPLRSHFCKPYTYIAPDSREPFNLLVVGGSQGSSLFSKLIPDAISGLPIDLQQRIIVHQQCRNEQLEIAEQEYRDLPCKVKLQPFFDDMEKQYEWAHLVITRSGSSSVFELIHTKRPAILFPYAAAIEGDQAKNANILKSKNACWVLNEKESGPKALSKILSELIDNPDQLTEKSKNIADLQKEEATKLFIKTIKQFGNNL